MKQINLRPTNPNGSHRRDRLLRMITESRGTTPTVDDQSLPHTGYAPWGRGNHYSESCRGADPGARC